MTTEVRINKEDSTKSTKSKPLTKKQLDFLKIFENKMCLITHACQAAKIDRGTYYLWLQNPIFKEQVDYCEEAVKDFGESALHTLIDQGNPQAVMFYNKTKNKNRGYFEKTEVHNKEIVDLSRLTEAMELDDESDTDNKELVSTEES